jgi:hypothetical protein
VLMVKRGLDTRLEIWAQTCDQQEPLLASEQE